jgi:hypothetical protein
MKRIAISTQTQELCSYGCGNTAKYINGSNRYMCDIASQKCPAVKLKNSEGLKKANASGKRNAKEIYNNSSLESKHKMNWRKEKYNADFSLNGKGSHKKALIQERGYKCESCNLSEWLHDPIPLELEHKDGNNKNNIKQNLLLLCPNCHAKTEFYRGRNINTGKIKVSDEALLTEINKNINIRQILINVGLTPKGANYERIKKLMPT